MRYFSYFIILYFLPVVYLQASYTGSPADPSFLQGGFTSQYLFHISSGYINDTVWDKKIRPKTLPDSTALKTPQEFKIESQWGAIILTLLKRLSVYTYLGVSKEKMDWENKPNYYGDENLKTKSHFSFSLGTKVILLRFGSLQIGVNAQYFSIPSVETIEKRIRDLYIPFPLSDQYLELKEWQAAVSAVKILGPFSVYGGLKWMQSKLKVSATGEPTLRFINQKNLGLFTGLTINITRALYGTIEGRFFDEYALSFATITAF